MKNLLEDDVAPTQGAILSHDHFLLMSDIFYSIVSIVRMEMETYRPRAGVSHSDVGHNIITKREVAQIKSELQKHAPASYPGCDIPSLCQLIDDAYLAHVFCAVYAIKPVFKDSGLFLLDNEEISVLCRLAKQRVPVAQALFQKGEEDLLRYFPHLTSKDDFNSSKDKSVFEVIQQVHNTKYLYSTSSSDLESDSSDDGFESDDMWLSSDSDEPTSTQNQPLYQHHLSRRLGSASIETGAKQSVQALRQRFEQ